MKVFIEHLNKEVDITAKNVKELLNKLKINPGTVIVVRNNELIIEETELDSKDKITIMNVISGG